MGGPSWRSASQIPPAVTQRCLLSSRCLVRGYRDDGGPPLPLVIPQAVIRCSATATGLTETYSPCARASPRSSTWEAAHRGDPLRELSRAAWGVRNDPRSFDALTFAYGADPAAVRAWLPVYAAELWLWFAEAGAAEYLDKLTEELARWPYV